jgi:hypothetical protein
LVFKAFAKSHKALLFRHIFGADHLCTIVLHLVARIHRRLFEEGATASFFGPSWDALAATA